MVTSKAAIVAVIVVLFPAAESAAAAESSSSVVCASAAGERIVCPADTSNGVKLEKSTGPGGCELGKSWGYDEMGIWVAAGCSGEFSLGRETPKRFGRYTPTRGFKVADTESGDLSIRVFTYLRYLNQKGLDPTYTDSFGQTTTLDLRQDVQLNKVTIYFFGWLLSPKFRYMAYIWSANTSQGLSAQVVVAGNLKYAFNEHFTLGGGINSLPGVRSTEGSFPYWLGVDNRLIADEFFRPSYTSGFWAEGKIADGWEYQLMLGNNLSQLGIDAGQLDPGLDTVSAFVAWTPTTADYGNGFGDFSAHEDVATRVAFHVSRSDEDRQSQPNTDAFDNVQLRLSDGNVIFEPDLFGPGIIIDQARYSMASLDAGFKYRGYSVEGEYYWRRLDNFAGPGTSALGEFRDHGFQIQTSAMPIPKSFQVYLSGSKVFGEYGNPWDVRAGVNWFPWKNQVSWLNVEYIHLDRSPVGGLSLPYQVGGTGPIFYTNFVLNF